MFPRVVDVPPSLVSLQLYQYHWYSSKCEHIILFCAFLCDYWSDFVQIWHRCSPGWIDVPPSFVSLALYQYHWYSSKCKQIILSGSFLCDYCSDFVQIWHGCSPGWIGVPPSLVSLALYQYHWYSSKFKHNFVLLISLWLLGRFCSNLELMFPRVGRCAC